MRTSANEIRRNAPALTRFAALLEKYRIKGRWSYVSLAGKIQSPREKQDFIVANTIANWCHGRSLPSEIEPLIRVLFGPDRNSKSEKREALRAAFNAAWA